MCAPGVRHLEGVPRGDEGVDPGHHHADGGEHVRPLHHHLQGGDVAGKYVFIQSLRRNKLLFLTENANFIIPLFTKKDFL